MKQLLKDLFTEYKIKFDEQMLEKFEQYYNIVIEENKKFNLTAITEKQDFAVKHLLDCVLPYELLPVGAKVLDVGAGAGFPSIPLKIIRPDLQVLMLDSLNKRVNFLNQTVNILKLENISAIHTRAEDYALKNRDSFDVVVARAVAKLNTLSEYCLPFVKIGGSFIALKGSDFEEELLQANNAIQILGGKVDNIQHFDVAQTNSHRANIVIKKIKPCNPKYPRSKNLPRLKPLV